MKKIEYSSKKLTPYSSIKWSPSNTQYSGKGPHHCTPACAFSPLVFCIPPHRQAAWDNASSIFRSTWRSWPDDKHDLLLKYKENSRAFATIDYTKSLQAQFSNSTEFTPSPSTFCRV